MRWTLEAKEATRIRAGAHGDQLAEGLADEPFGAGHARALGIRRVAEEEVDAAIAELRQPADVGAQPVDGRVVELVVAGVQDPAAGRVEHDRDRVRDRVRHADELRLERPELDRLAFGIGLAQLRRAQQAVLVELRLDQPERQPSRPDLLDARLAQQVRERADMVLVAVRQQHRAHRLVAVDEVREVGQDQVDAKVLVARKREPGVDHDRLAVGLDHGHVLAHFAEAAERDDLGASGHRPSVGQYGGLTGSRVEPDRRMVRLSVLAYATVAAGLGVTVAGAIAAAGRPLTALALFGAAALAAELLEEPESARIREPLGPGVFRVASGVDLAAVIVLGPWRGAFVAGTAALLARIVRGSWRQAAFQASAYRARLGRRRLRLRARRRTRRTPDAARRPRAPDRAGARLPARLAPAAAGRRRARGAAARLRRRGRRGGARRDPGPLRPRPPVERDRGRAGRAGRQPGPRARATLTPGDAPRPRDLREHRRRARTLDLPPLDPRGRLRRLARPRARASPTPTSTACAGPRACTTSARSRSTRPS